MNTSKSSSFAFSAWQLHLVFAASIIAPMLFTSQSALAAKPIMRIRHPIAIIGLTDDKRYPIYDLKGETDDLNYHSGNGIIYQPDDLPARIGFIKPADATSGAYVCQFTCQDKKGRTVGVNPAWAKIYGMKLTEKK